MLSLDLYLKLEKRRKESRENPSSTHHNPENPDGLFDFDKVTDAYDHLLANKNVGKILIVGIDKYMLK